MLKEIEWIYSLRLCFVNGFITFDDRMQLEQVFIAKNSKTHLDQYLERGWFRMNQLLFTTHFICINEQFYSAIWFRYILDESMLPTLEKRLNTIAKKIRIETGKWVYSEQQEKLYEKYAFSQPFHVTPSLHALMLSGNEPNVFDTRQICFYDGDKLIAVGLYDVGTHTAAGITNFYDPDYKKLSPGKYLIYAKLYECVNMQLDYFYPGYIVAGNERFNYKINIIPQGREYFDVQTQSWLPFEQGMAIPDYLPLIQQALELVQIMLSNMNRESYCIYYLYFDIAQQLITAGRGIHLPLILYAPIEAADAQLGIVIVYKPDVHEWQVNVVAALHDDALKVDTGKLIYINELIVLYEGASFKDLSGLEVYLNHLYLAF